LIKKGEREKDREIKKNSERQKNKKFLFFLKLLRKDAFRSPNNITNYACELINFNAKFSNKFKASKGNNG